MLMTTSKHGLIRQYIDSFPVLPESVTRLTKVTNDPGSSAKDVMAVILPDQSLCLTVLKIANSVLFGRPQKVDSIQTAVTILGFDEVQRIALTKAMVNSFNKLAGPHRVFIDKYWEHSFVCGIAARIIARDLSLAQDTAYMGGLFHDIGKLIMLQTYGEEYQSERWMTTFSDETALREELLQFSFTHDRIGGQLLRKWAFPKNLISVVANHHHPQDATEEKLTCVIQLADLLSFYCCNRHLMEDDDIHAAACEAIPDMEAFWQTLGLAMRPATLRTWYEGLLEYHEQGLDLIKAFS
jgi:putative nucleotidyltransferase with HDIG domain